MNPTPRLLAVLAHPDDESLGFGGTLARYAAAGADVRVLTATRGEAGRYGDGTHPGKAEVGRLREAELRAACGVLGVREVSVCGFPDGGLHEVALSEGLGWLVPEIRRIRPDVILTFGPDGAYGHPDHITVGQWALAATVLAAAPAAADASGDMSSHHTSRLYHLAWPGDVWAAYQAAFRTLTYTFRGVARQAVPWPDWAITTRIDATPWSERVWHAVQCHRTQMTIYDRLAALDDHQRATLFGRQSFCRILDLDGVALTDETDLFPSFTMVPA
jgi:LmbE family N-acetylglucosaminyl deacetylase